MRLLGRYLWQRRGCIGMFALFLGLFAACFALGNLPLKAILYPAGLCALLGAVWLGVGFYRFWRRHLALQRQVVDRMAQLPEPEGPLEADYQEIVEALRGELTELKASADARYWDMLDYYTTWVHQIKTPIASMRLTLQNEDSPLSRRLGSDLFRIEQYVEMVLAYLRLNSTSTDYVFRTCGVDEMVRQAVKKFAAEFIGRRLSLNYTPVPGTVVTDEKWFVFVLEQLLSNALKYTREGGVSIWMEGSGTLCIRDTGIGIDASDLPRVFERGYTGRNGRKDKRASGLGLYLCRQVCKNLEIGLELDSRPGEGTTVRLGLDQYQLRPE